MKKFHKNTLPRYPKLSMEKSARIRWLARGLQGESSRIVSHAAGRILTAMSEPVVRLQGSGFISTIFLKLGTGANPEAGEARVRVYTNGRETPDIDQSVYDFFMSGWEGKLTFSDYAGKNASLDGKETTYYRQIFLPYERGCKIELANETGEALDAACSVQYSQTGEPADYGRLSAARGCAKAGRSGVWGEEITLLDLEGRGVFHSFQFSMKNRMSAGDFMEGNIEIYIDDNEFPEYQSTGTEEFFMGGIYFTNLHTSAYSGCTRTFNDGSENPEHIISAQRYFVEDPITFDRRLRILWHNGQPGQALLKGTTDYDFAGIYYLDKRAGSPVKAMAADEAELALSGVDSDRFALPLRGLSFDIAGRAGENVLFGADGAGSLEAVHLSFADVSALLGAKLLLELDGRRTDEAPVDWFFLNAQGTPGYTGDCGKTSEGTYYKLCDIAYTKSCRLILKLDGATDVSGYVEYRTGERTAFWRQGIRVIPGGGPAFTQIAGPGEHGYVEAVLAHGKFGSRAFLEMSGADDTPLAMETLGDFFLNPGDFGIQRGLSRCAGVLENDGKAFTVLRDFSNSRFAFNDGLRARLLNADAGTTLVVFYKQRAPEQDGALRMSLPGLTARLNMNDFAYGGYETRCYNPIEGHDGRVPAGETHVMFEDFDAGMIKCIRFGTPPTGSALHEAQFKLFLDGAPEPAVDTTFGRFFSADFHDPLFWSQTRCLSRLSKRGGENPKNMGQHSSFFRYMNIPYRSGAKLTLTAPTDSEVNGFDNVYYASARGGAEDFGFFGTMRCESGEFAVRPGEDVRVAGHDGVGALTSIQLMAWSDAGNGYLNARLKVFTGGAEEPLLDVPLCRYFFGAGPQIESPGVKNGYTDFWQDIQDHEEGYFSAPEIGWIRRGHKSPYRNVMYRLLDRRPVLLEGCTEIYLCNTTDQAFHIQSDIVIRRNNNKIGG